MKEDIQKGKRSITDINNLFIIIFASLLIFTVFTSNARNYINKFNVETLETYLSVTNLVISLSMIFFLSHKQKLIYEIKNSRLTIYISFISFLFLLQFLSIYYYFYNYEWFNKFKSMNYLMISGYAFEYFIVKNKCIYNDYFEKFINKYVFLIGFFSIYLSFFSTEKYLSIFLNICTVFNFIFTIYFRSKFFSRVDSLGILSFYCCLSGSILNILGLMIENSISSFYMIGSFLFLANFSNFFHLLKEFENSFENLRPISMALARKMGELSKAHIDADRAQVAKEHFLAIMSHEIRTPINGIVGYSEILSSTEINEEQKRLIGMITTSTSNLMRLIDDVLDLPNLISGEINIESMPFDIVQLVESVIDVQSPKSFEKGIDLTYFIESSVPRIVFGDPKRIGQVLLNLANNALKFTEKGEVFIGVKKIDLTSDQCCELEFEVKDTGPGIAKDKLNILFKPFSQTDVSITRRYGGTGLGLSISKQLIEYMNGKIWVESSLGQGTRFIFKIKLKVSQVQIKSFDIQKTEGIKCLVVSENLTNRYILGRRFKQWKINGKIANSFENAQNILNFEDFDLMIVDIGADTKKASLFLKENKSNCGKNIPSLSIISLGKNTIENLETITCDTIPKPIKTSNLFEKIVNLHMTYNKKNKSDKNLENQKENYDNKEMNFKNNHINTDANIKNNYSFNILVAEDNIVNQKLILSILEKLGHQAMLVENGALAVEKISNKNNFDIILMDLQMPVMDGIEATRRIISMEHILLKPKIIALTANAMTGDREKCLEAGMNDYLTKPIQINILQQSIIKWGKLFREELS